MRRVRKAGREFSVIDHHPDDPDGVDFWSLFEAGWEADTFVVLGQYLGPGVTFLDVGAWVGPITMVAAHLCDEVTAIEPDPVALADLRVHLAVNELRNVKLIEGAVSVSTDRMTLGRKAGGALGDSMTSVLYDLDAFETPTVHIADIVPDRCALIKVDIEGHEADALADFDASCPVWLSTHSYLTADPADYWDRLDRFLGRHRVDRVSGHDLLVLP